MADDEDVKISFGASIDGVTKGIEAIKNQFAGLSGAVGKLAGSFVAVEAVLQGGKMFSNALKSVEQLAEHINRLSNQTGMSLGRSQAWAEALEHAGSSGEAFASTLLRMQMRMTSNEAQFRAYGITTRDATTGALLPAEQIFKSTIQTLMGLEAGTNRNQAALQLLGRNMRDVDPYARAMRADLEKIEEEHKKLGITVTTGSTLMSRNWSTALKQAGDVGEGFKRVLADELMPVLTRMANQLSEAGPGIVEGFRTIVAGISSVVSDVAKFEVAVVDAVVSGWSSIMNYLQSLTGSTTTNLQRLKDGVTGLRMVWETFSFTVKAILNAFVLVVKETMVGITALVAAADAYFNAPWGSKGDAMKKAFAVGWQSAKDEWEIYKAQQEKALADYKATMSGLVSPEEAPYSNEGKTYAGGKFGKAQSNVRETAAIEQARLARAQAEAAGELAIAQELGRQTLAMYQDLYNQKLITVEEFFNKKKELQLSDIDAERRMLEDQRKDAAKLASSGMTVQERLRGQMQLVQINERLKLLETQRAGLNAEITRQIGEANRKLEDQRATIEQETRSISDSAGLDQMQQVLAARRGMGQITQDEAVASEQKIEDERYKIQMQGLALRFSLARADQEEQKKVLNDILKARMDHESKVTDITTRAMIQRNQLNRQFNAAFFQASESLFVDLVQHVKNTRDVFHQFYVSIVTAFEKLIAKRLFERLFGDGTAGKKFIDKMVDTVIDGLDTMLTQFMAFYTAKTGITAAGEAASTAAVAAGNAETMVLETAAAEESIGLSISRYFAKLVAWFGELGPFAVPAAIAVAGGALAIAHKAFSSAEGGAWKLPSNQLINAHAGEMIIPAKEAQALRDMVTSKGAGGATHLHVHAVDAKSVERLFRDNGDALVSVLKRQRRNFAF